MGLKKVMFISIPMVWAENLVEVGVSVNPVMFATDVGYGESQTYASPSTRIRPAVANIFDWHERLRIITVQRLTLLKPHGCGNRFRSGLSVRGICSHTLKWGAFAPNGTAEGQKFWALASRAKHKIACKKRQYFVRSRSQLNMMDFRFRARAHGMEVVVGSKEVLA
jgi:hypothetical protein